MARRQDYTKQAVIVVVRSSGEKEMIGSAVGSLAPSENQRPKTTDGNRVPIPIFELTEKNTRLGIEDINVPVVYVANEQFSTAWTEIPWSDDHSPRPLQGSPRTVGADPLD